MLRPSEESIHANHQDQHSTAKSITKQYSTNTNITRESENTRFNEVRQLANEVRQLADVLSGQKGDLIQTTDLQGLQIDPKIQIENLRNLPENSLKQTNSKTLNTNSLVQVTL